MQAVAFDTEAAASLLLRSDHQIIATAEDADEVLVEEDVGVAIIVVRIGIEVAIESTMMMVNTDLAFEMTTGWMILVKILI